MKKKLISLTLTLLLVGGLFTRCEQKLNLSPLGKLDEQTYFQTEEDFKGAVLLAYSTLLNYTYEQGDAGGWFQTMLLPDDDATTANNNINNLEIFNWVPTAGQFRAIWETTYKGVQRSNIILEKIPEATDLSPEQAESFEGEVRFLRAYFNFILASQFGTAPLIETTPRTVEDTRAVSSKPGELWDAVIADLKIAKDFLPETRDDANLGRADRVAAIALLGKTLLFRAQWDKNPDLYTQAAAEFESIIGKRSLVAAYGNNFKPSSENNAESVFEIQMGIGGNNPWLPVDFNFDGNGEDISAGSARLIYFRAACGLNPGDCAPGANAQGYGSVQIAQPLQKEFEPGDPRRAATIFLEGDAYNTGENADGSQGWIYRSVYSATGSSPAKYVLGDNNIDFRSPLSINNQRVIRYADVLLMLAECKILGPTKDLAGAAALINQVRRRADPTSRILPNVTATTETALFSALRHERRVELALEDHRYNDLVRWHRAGLINIKTDIDFGRPQANQAWSEKNLLKPIPQSERDLNPDLVQNTGY
ncbi:RagB/SusD family nutrient uptake outer membrane protein [Dyadobacter bucti]|uniref:RagB/SusD family nutrient uptake outer membrane protein n=1 Tax=Dyadobacter bucti TaxID=2572203 RepID=UPI003F708907